MKSVVIQCLTILVTALTVNCGMQLNFGVNLPPFVLRLPRFKLPPVRMSVTFNHSPDSQPLKIHFPGISISNSNQNHNSWSDDSVAPEPESEPDSMYHEPEVEPETYSHQQFNPYHNQQYHQYHQQQPITNHRHSYDDNRDFYGDKSLAKATPSAEIGSYHLQQRSRRDSMMVMDTNGGPVRQNQPKIAIKPIINKNKCVTSNCLPQHQQLWISQYHQHLGSQSPPTMVTKPSTITNNNLRLTLISPPKSTSPLPSNLN